MRHPEILGPDLLRTAALADPATALAAWHAWMGRGSPAAPDPVSRRWLPLVWWNLREAGLDDASSALLERSREQAWSAARRMLAGARPALEAIEQAGIQTLLLKGVALAFTVYDRPDLRPFGDVDVLVESWAGPEARGIVERLGWRPLRPVAPASLALRHSLGFGNADGARVDLHWHALAECCGAGADDGFWSRAEALRVDGRPARLLGPADQLLHVCVHGLRWTRPPSGHWIADAVTILRRAGAALDWEVLLEEARRRRLTHQVRQALDVVGRYPRVAIPAAVTADLAATRPGWQERLECRLKGKPPSRARLLFLFWRTYCRATSGQSVLSRPVGFARHLPALAGWDLRGGR